MSAAPEVVVYTRQGCHLCEHALDVLRRLGRDLEFELREVDVDADPRLTERYGERVPVVAVAGREVAEGRVGAAAVRRAIVEATAAGAVDRAGRRS